MPVVGFVAGALCGFLFTAFAVYRLKQRGLLTPQLHSLVLAIGFGFTAALAFFVPFLMSGAPALNDWLVVLGMANSIILGILTYGLARLYLGRRTK
jgi:hypothetical protein